jgi:hypothetical protein
MAKVSVLINREAVCWYAVEQGWQSVDLSPNEWEVGRWTATIEGEVCVVSLFGRSRSAIVGRVYVQAKTADPQRSHTLTRNVVAAIRSQRRERRSA